MSRKPTRAPCPANARVKAAPIPLPPPVMKTVLSARPEYLAGLPVSIFLSGHNFGARRYSTHFPSQSKCLAGGLGISSGPERSIFFSLNGSELVDRPSKLQTLTEQGHNFLAPSGS